ncbi:MULTISPECIES: hypothetical protein [unclassified Rhizobium]|uniref:hypothetical protein n=1 Tax=unclassified Rhizobium TaxID=2613769 RepID=UPI0010E9512B|nr:MULTISPECIES: hypothetical protein [unclassified Rhizobium]TCS03306.1 hypothetical protein EV281_104389 [Rhizobium sp. BK418]
MFAAFKTFLVRFFRGHEQPVFDTSARVMAEDSESRMRSLREEELFFWQPTPLSWY